MHKILVISDSYPHPDKASGDLRFYTLLTLLAQKHHVSFFMSDLIATCPQCEDGGKNLEQAGITLCKENLPFVLKHFKPEIVWFEFFYQFRDDYLGVLQRCSPNARIVVDSVDVHFNRFEAYARLTGKLEDVIAARKIKDQELAAYSRADMVIAVSEDDRRLIQQNLPDLPVEVIPNLHSVQPFPDPVKRRYGELVFVGGYKHAPNVDAMLYFCSKVMPQITASCPQARLKIIGSNSPPEIFALASESIEVLGYVPETAPFLESAYISIAPLRYGGGMKGKVGEAMSCGLPVVTTSYGAEGFGLTPGKDFLIGDNAESFAAQVIALLEDADLYARIARSGYDFIEQHYSVAKVSLMLDSSLGRLALVSQHKIPLAQRLMMSCKYAFERHVAWRMKKARRS